MDKKSENKRLLFLTDLFEYSLRNSFPDTVQYLALNSRRIISNLSLFISLDVGEMKCFVYAHRKVKKSYLSSVLEGIRKFGASNSLDVEPSRYTINVEPNEEFVDSEGPKEPNFTLTIPVFASGKSRALINFSTSGPVSAEENDVSYINLIGDFLSALWEREAKAVEEKKTIENLAFLDSLTGVFNRGAFYKLFSQDLSEARRNGTALSLAVFDIDGFKQINDSNGHAYGDMILRQVTAQFKKLLRQEDRIFRLGGDEFALLMKTDKKDAYTVTNRIIREISNTRSARVTLSGGIVEVNPYKTSDLDHVMREADKALYVAKESGKNQMVLAQDRECESGSIESENRLNIDREIERLTEDINLKLREFATNEIASVYLSLNKEEQSLYEKPAGVSDYAVSLARELNLPESRLQNLRLGAVLYDIGMIAVPRSIILKNSGLTPDEYELIKHHTIIGGRMIQQFGILRDVLAVVLYHHEWINGRGYPFGLTGDHIPLEARIIAVADAFYAMDSNRPYRSALVREEAISQLIKGRGIKYDSEVIEAFLSLVDKGIVAPH